MSEQNSSSVSAWVCALKEGEADAAQKIWDRYFEKLVRQAEIRLRDCPPNVLCAEDVAVSVFESLWRGAQAGRFHDLRNRDELWWLLLALTRRKAASHIRRETAQKRGGGAARQSLTNDDSGGYNFEELVSTEPTPEYLLELDEEFSRILSRLNDDRTRRIAVLKIEGYENVEISQQLEIALVTVTRKLRLIRETWSRELER